ncbi:site-specific integrase [Gordonia sp. PP30]|uniref:tyrosine-type recombinase/integrase n=1 Tax=Gordonia sp. PP30 TaxID=2935861 RepID=UPI0020003B7D|nr:tyrosine-type recombinase/integrase [Gordonia sp. PP30]UQE74706.1 site-specific integrase [Gordonia sp. PP30]
MGRQQLPSGITKVTVKNRRTGKPEPRWRVQLNIGEGDQRHQVRRSFTTEAAARSFRSKTLGDVEAGAYVRGSHRTIEQACADWLTSKHNLKSSTRRGYISALQPVRDQLGEIAVQKLTKRDLDDLVVQLRAGQVERALDDGTTKARKKYAARTINKMIGTLSQVLASEQAQGHLARNVAALVDHVPVEAKEYRTLTEAEMYRVLDHQCRDRHLWTLALYGLRRGEIAGLRWCDVDLTAGTVTIRETRVDGVEGIVVDTPKSRTSARTLPMPVDVVKALKAARKQQWRERLALGEAYAGGEYLASDEAGRPLNTWQISAGWERVLRDLGIERVRLHDARHTCGTLMHLRGVPIREIAQWLGHSSPAFTMATYVHSQGEALKAAGQSFDRVEAT